MNPDLSLLLRDWLLEQHSEWKHTDEISWENGKTKGSIHSKTHGFITHPLSQNLSEVLWIGAGDVWVPPVLQAPGKTNVWLLAADPEFFDKLKKAMDLLRDIFKTFPDRNAPDWSSPSLPKDGETDWIIQYSSGS